MAMRSIIKSDGNGSTVIGIKPHIIGIGAIITLSLFIATVIYAAGGKTAKIAENEKLIIANQEKIECLTKLEKKVTKLNIMVSLLCQKEGIEIPRDE